MQSGGVTVQRSQLKKKILQKIHARRRDNELFLRDLAIAVALEFYLWRSRTRFRSISSQRARTFPALFGSFKIAFVSIFVFQSHSQQFFWGCRFFVSLRRFCAFVVRLELLKRYFQWYFLMLLAFNFSLFNASFEENETSNKKYMINTF